MQSRHIDDGTSIYSFANLFLVHCPKCDSCAQVVRIGDAAFRPPGRLTCTHCGHAKERCLSGWSDNEPRDWYFQLPLWLQTPCCGDVLWAFNLKHLSFLESYIEADHRTGLSDEEAKRLGIRNATLASRLPEWMIVAKHRTEVLKCIDKLRQLATTQQ
jgi:hypothetical protein